MEDYIVSFLDTHKEFINSDHVLNLQILSCYFMTGVIWIIQIVHYPSFKFIEFKQFLNFQKFHTQMITFVVAPMMVLEIFTAFYLLVVNDFSTYWTIHIVLLIAIWLCTAFLSVPIHNLLAKPHITDVERLQLVKLLVKTNWPRTLLWSLRSLLFIIIIINFRSIL